jgi:hypothetical protein
VFLKELFDFFSLKGQKSHQDKVVIKLKLILFADKSQNGFRFIALIGLVVLHKERLTGTE